MSDTENKKENKVPWMELWEFLMSTPPGKVVNIKNCLENDRLVRPPILLYCDSNACKAKMYFDCVNDWDYIREGEWRPAYLLYRCRHCEDRHKWFGLLVYKESLGLAKVRKLGEVPPFGPHAPSGVISLVGKNRELFLKGRAAEARGLGIGAFTYYRRVVDNEWKRLLDAAIKVAKRLELPSDALEKAKAESQFAKAVDMVKEAIPQVLLIDGHNPMTMLYKILSQGIHQLTDEECLELAKHIRVILADFADRVGEALRERRELKESLTQLFQADKPQELSKEADSQSEEEDSTLTE